jgi:hypothetical protein
MIVDAQCRPSIPMLRPGVLKASAMLLMKAKREALSKLESGLMSDGPKRVEQRMAVN